MEQQAGMSEGQVKKILAYLKNQLMGLSTGTNTKKNTSKIIEWFSQTQNRVIKLFAYPVIKSIPDLDYQLIFNSISADLVSQDDEIQLNTMKLIFQISPEVALELIRSSDKEFHQILKKSQFHYERLVCLHDFLIKAYLKNFSQDMKDDCRDHITQLYLKMAESVFSSNRDIARDSIQVFQNLFHTYLQNVPEITVIENFFDANGSYDQLILPLIMQLTGFFLPRIETIMSKILSYEIRLRAWMLTFIVQLVKVGFILGRSCYMQTQFSINSSSSMLDSQPFTVQNSVSTSFNLIDFYDQLLNVHLIDQKDIVQSTMNNIFSLLALSDEFPEILQYHKRCQIVWKVFEYTIHLLERRKYRSLLNLNLLNIAILGMKINNTTQIAVSMKMLQLGCSTENSQLVRYLIMEVCLLNFIESSLQLICLGRQSCIFSLFQQSWFLSKIKEEENPDPTLPSLQIKQQLLSCLITMLIYTQVKVDASGNQQSRQHFQKIALEIMDVAYRMINWNYVNKPSFCNIYNKMSQFAIDMFLILLQESLKFTEKNQVNLRVIELIKRINNNEVNFLTQLQSIYVFCQNFSLSDIPLMLDCSIIISDIRQYMIQPSAHSIFFEKYLNSLPHQGDLIKYINNIEFIFTCLYYFSIKFNNPQQNDLKKLIFSLIKDYQDYLTALSKSKGTLNILIFTIQQYVDSITNLITSDSHIDPEMIHISLEFLDTLDLEPPVKQQLIYEPQDLFFVSFNIFAQGICANQLTVESLDTIEGENPMKNIHRIYTHLSDPQCLNQHFKMNFEPQLITGICDFIQVYACHSVLIPKMLVSINLKIVNTSSFKLDNVQVQIMYSEGFDMYPQQSIKKFITFEELQPFTAKTANFCLICHKVNTLYVSFDTSAGFAIGGGDPDDGPSGGQSGGGTSVSIRTLPYQISLLNFILPNSINILSKQFFHYIWSDMSNQGTFQCLLNRPFQYLWHQLQNSNFSCVILEGMEDQLDKMKQLQSSPDHKLEEQLKKDDEGISSQKIIKLGLLGLTWDGFNIAISISGISSVKQNGIVTIEIKASKNQLIELIKNDFSNFIEELTYKMIILMN